MEQFKEYIGASSFAMETGVKRNKSSSSTVFKAKFFEVQRNVITAELRDSVKSLVRVLKNDTLYLQKFDEYVILMESHSQLPTVVGKDTNQQPQSKFDRISFTLKAEDIE